MTLAGEMQCYFSVTFLHPSGFPLLFLDLPNRNAGVRCQWVITQQEGGEERDGESYIPRVKFMSLA